MSFPRFTYESAEDISHKDDTFERLIIFYGVELLDDINCIVNADYTFSNKYEKDQKFHLTAGTKLESLDFFISLIFDSEMGNITTEVFKIMGSFTEAGVITYFDVMAEPFCKAAE